ncbi:hypothetical protein [Paenibacillus sp. PL2-23]|uniref:hypothetical protein n=1 Tax=Paenibacillus sp. PL2-23 TaxID=2100729 RepID=UPI0030F5625B
MQHDKLLRKKQLADAPFQEERFSLGPKRNGMNRTKEADRQSAKLRWPLLWLLPVLVTVLGVAIYLLSNGEPSTRQDALSQWASYNQQGELLYRINPDPNVQAGKSYGYIFSFEAPFDTFEGKQLAIMAKHTLTGQQIPISTELIQSPSPGYDSLNRYSVQFTLPSGGVWVTTVRIDGEVYGESLMVLQEEAAN